MPIRLELPQLDSQNRLFLSWAPVRGRLRQVDEPGAAQDINVILRNSGSTGLLWFANDRTDFGQPEVQLTLPADGTPVEFWMAGDFMNPSDSYGDAAINFIRLSDSSSFGIFPTMVRVRKNANTLTPAERDRFLNALATLNGQGAGRFAELRAMHTNEGSREAHGGPGFLPWHRAYMLDLERELQSIDPQVTLPYWRFDEPAPNLFSADFMGVSNYNGGSNLDQEVRFNAGHPLTGWATNGMVGIDRGMRPPFTPDVAPPVVLTEAATLALGGQISNAQYGSFLSSLEGNPHGQAHVRFVGYVSAIHTAARDPVFFMLHANVDRLWAKWQWLAGRHNRDNQSSFASGGSVGHTLDDTMWPWNGITGGSRPVSAPGGALQASETASLPGPSPTVAQMMDYVNVLGREDQPSGGTLGFCYDDVPFQFESGGAVA